MERGKVVGVQAHTAGWLTHAHTSACSLEQATSWQLQLLHDQSACTRAGSLIRQRLARPSHGDADADAAQDTHNIKLMVRGYFFFQKKWFMA